MTTHTLPTEEKKGGFFANFKFPSAYTILFALIAIVALMTWIIPAGQYERAMNEDLGREVPVTGTYHSVDANPQGWLTYCLRLSMASMTTTATKLPQSTFHYLSLLSVASLA